MHTEMIHKIFNHRAGGILLHITSLPSPFGIGDLGPGAYRFVDFLAETHQRYWQILPLTPIDSAFGNSPYSSASAFAANTLLISPELLMKEGDSNHSLNSHRIKPITTPRGFINFIYWIELLGIFCHSRML